MSADFKPTIHSYKNLGSFRFWCQKVLPAVYDDSLSYYEVMCKITDYLNNVIDNMDNLHLDMEDMYAAYGQLEDYVNHYFDNLDVQIEINNKLDAMAVDGSLSALIAPFVEALLPDEVASRISAVVESQLPAVVRIQLPPELASQLPAEVAAQIPDLVTAWLNLHIVQPVEVIIDDSLTISGAAADAKTVGDAISELKSALSDENDRLNSIYVIMYSNLIDPSKMLNDKYINKSGVITDATVGQGYWVSDYIPVMGQGIASECGRNSAIASSYATYDANKQQIRYVSFSTNDEQYEYQSGDVYVRFCGRNTLDRPPMANYGSKLKTYIAYGVIGGVNDCIAMKDDVDTLKAQMADVYPLLYTNLIDFANASEDKYISSTGAIQNATAGQGYWVSDYIPTLGKNIASECIKGSTVIYSYNAYNANKEIIRTVTLSSGQDYQYVNGDVYVRLCGRNLLDRPPMANYGNVLWPYIAYGVIGGWSQCVELQQQINELQNDTSYVQYLLTDIVGIGDSTCAGLVSDYPNLRDTRDIYSFLEFMCRENNWKYRNEGHTGYNAEDWIENIYETGTYGKFQVALIDFGYNETISNTLETDVEPYQDWRQYADTPCGNYCKVIGILQEENPNIIIMPIIQARASATNVSTIKAITEYFQLDYIDLTKSDLNDTKYHGYYSAETMEQETLDMTHFNLLGYCRKGYVVKNGIIENLLKNVAKTNEYVSKQQAAYNS